MHTFFKLAGLPFEAISDSSVPSLKLPPAYIPFLSSEMSTHPCCQFRSIPSDREVKSLTPPFQWECLTWRMGKSGADSWGIEIHSVPHDKWISVADIASDFSSARLKPIAGRQGLPSPYLLNYPTDHVVIANRLLDFNAGILHASGIIHNGQGFVFCGRSGIGKTTLARLWKSAGSKLLNDDRVIIRREGNSFYLYSSPWHGEENVVENLRTPLKGIFHLSQAPENKLTDLSGVTAAAQLLATAVAPFYSPGRMTQWLSLADRIVDSVPSYSLAFTPDERVIDFCIKAVSRAC